MTVPQRVPSTKVLISGDQSLPIQQDAHVLVDLLALVVFFRLQQAPRPGDGLR